MIFLYIAASLALLFVIAALITALVCFFRIFYAGDHKDKEEYPIPEGRIYEPYRERMINWMKETKKLPQTDVSIKSFDGLTLRGKYFEYEKGAPIEILFHGYKGSSKRDLCGGVYRCRTLGHNALIVDHRASGESDGKVITFGIKESRDCLDWVNFVIENIDPDARIIITGISMGAATVMIAAGDEKLPSNVIGALADCGYTSARDIIKKVIRDMKLPADLLYPCARLGAKLFGGFDPDAKSPIESLKKSRVPVIFFHGDTDDFVPHEMSVRNYEACITRKRLVTTPGAGHGLCFVADKESYFAAVREFYPRNRG